MYLQQLRPSVIFHACRHLSCPLDFVFAFRDSPWFFLSGTFGSLEALNFHLDCLPWTCSVFKPHLPPGPQKSRDIPPPQDPRGKVLGSCVISLFCLVFDCRHVRMTAAITQLRGTQATEHCRGGGRCLGPSGGLKTLQAFTLKPHRVLSELPSSPELSKIFSCGSFVSPTNRINFTMHTLGQHCAKL